MCTSSEISVTTNIIITQRPSIWMPAWILTPLNWNHVTCLTTGNTVASPPASPRCPTLRPRAPSAVPPLALWTRWIHCTTAPHERMNDALNAAMPISDPSRGMRLPKNRIATNDSAGISGMSHAQLRKNTPLVLQHFEIVEIGRMEIAVNQQHNGETNAHFGRRDREHEQREHLADHRGLTAVEGAERNQVEVDRG